MTSRSRRRRDRTSRLPKELRPLVGGALLVAAVRTVDAVWRRVTGRPTPVETSADGDADAPTPSTEPAVVRDRLLYAALLGGALRLARRMGLPKDEPKDDLRNGKSPA